jgi:hypothetical protein
VSQQHIKFPETSPALPLFLLVPAWQFFSPDHHYNWYYNHLMKPFYLLIALLAFTVCTSAQVTGGVSYSLSMPQQEMRENIRPIHGLNIMFLSKFKKLDKLSWGAEFGFGEYAAFTKDQDIRFPDGTGIKTKVSYSSNTASAGLLGRYTFLNEAKVNPYVSAKLGYTNFFSKVIVADPHDDDDCKPLDKKTPINDHSFFATIQHDINEDWKVTGQVSHFIYDMTGSSAWPGDRPWF